jgi:hypothetical protein
MVKEKIKTIEKQPSKTKEELVKESKRIEESTLHSAKGHFVAASLWSYFHLSIGIPIVVMSAIAGLSILSQFDKNKIIAGILTLVVAGLSALTTFLNPNGRSNSHLNCGNSYDALNNKVRIFRTIDCYREKSEDILTEKLKFFSEQKDKLNSTSPGIPWIAYKLAKRGIEKGEADFNVDKVIPA